MTRWMPPKTIEFVPVEEGMCLCFDCNGIASFGIVCRKCKRVAFMKRDPERLNEILKGLHDEGYDTSAQQ